MNKMIRLDTFDKIKRFIDITSSLDYELELVSGRYVVDGKSILGVLSIDLSKPVMICITGTDKYPKLLEEFTVIA